MSDGLKYYMREQFYKLDEPKVLTNAEVRKALKKSIKKWKAIVAGVGASQGIDNCPLCQMFYEDNCVGCPVSVDSGDVYCDSTPYNDWTYESSQGLENISYAVTAHDKQLAQAELNYLKSLDKKFFQP